MKTAEQCNDINEIRDCIDQIDKEIITSLSHRAAYVRCASNFKKSVKEVKASDRVKSIIETRQQWAKEAGIDPDFIKSLYLHIVDYFINGEMNDYLNSKLLRNEILISDATPEDAGQLLAIQKRAFLQEAELVGNYNIAPIAQTLTEFETEFHEYHVLKCEVKGEIVGSVRAKHTGSTCYIGRLVVEPNYQKQGYGSLLLNTIESRFPGTDKYELFTGKLSKGNIHFYEKHGYKTIDQFSSSDGVELVKMEKTATLQI